MTNLFKPKVSLVNAGNYTPSFTGGGLTGTSTNGVGVVNQFGGDRANILKGIEDLSNTAGNTYGDLYNTVKPGFNDLLTARLAQINDAARSAVGNLRENLSSRRVLGSSFGQDTISRANAEFSRQRDNAIADNFLKSLEAQRQLTADQFNARIKAFQPKLDELNLEAGLASSLAMAGSKAMADAALFNAKNQNAASEAGTTSLGSILGTGFGLAKNAISGLSPTSLFGGGVPFAQQAFWNAGNVGPV